MGGDRMAFNVAAHCSRQGICLSTYRATSLQPGPTVAQLLSQILSCAQGGTPLLYAVHAAIIGMRGRRRQRGLTDSPERGLIGQCKQASKEWTGKRERKKRKRTVYLLTDAGWKPVTLNERPHCL